MEVGSSLFLHKMDTSKGLPTLPHILLKLIEICHKEEANITDISHIIDKDPSLSSRVMGIVNSSYHNLPKRVTNIEQALAFLGTDAIKNIAISASVSQAFEKVEDRSVFDLKRFWEHSLMCAILSELIAKKTLYTSPDEAFLSGLLHDVGKLILWVHFSKKYSQMLQSSNDQPDLLLAVERRLGVTHCEVGALMINRWNLQSFMADAVLYHHEPVERIIDAFPLVKIIYVANLLCPETDNKDDVLLEIPKEVFWFSWDEVEELTLQARGKVEQIARSLDIEIEHPQVSGKKVSHNDHEKYDKLVQEVKDISLLQCELKNLLKAYSEDSILTVVQQGLQVLFDVNIIFFFLYDPEKDILVGKGLMGNEHAHLINKVVIPFQKEKSLLVQSLCQGIPLDSFSYSKKAVPTIMDEQIIRLLGKEGLLCLPMVARKEYIGVIVIGTDETHISHLYKQMKLLTMFTKDAALALHANYLRQNQTELIQSQRLTALSGIARKVVHEVNTPLSIIKNYLKIFGKKVAEENLGQEELRIINEEIDRMALIVGELSDYSEPKVQPTEPLDINAFLSEVIKILQESLLLGPHIDVHLTLEPLLPTTILDKNSLKQVFINLFQNAAEALPEGGNLYIHTRYAPNDLEGKPLPGMESGREYVEITISDDGPGIPDTIKSQLFKPFMSTKKKGHAGLGLSIVYNMVKELKGTITCKSDNKNGTSFTIGLPIVQNHAS